MTKSAFIVLATIVLALGLTTAARAQLPEKRFITPDGRRPSGLFAPGVMVGKTLYIAGKGDYKPNEEFDVKVKNCLERDREDAEAGGPRLRARRQIVRLSRRSRQVRRPQQVLRRVFPQKSAGPHDARCRSGAGRFAAGNHVHCICRPRAAKSDRPAARAIAPTAPRFWPATRSIFPAKATKFPTAAIRPRSKSKCGSACGMSRRSLKEAGLDFRQRRDEPCLLSMTQRIFQPPPKCIDEFFEEGSEPACALRFTSIGFPAVLMSRSPASPRPISPTAQGRPPRERSTRRMASERPAQPFGQAARCILSGRFGSQAGTLAEGVDAQVHQLAKNDIAVLDAAGLTLEDIVSGTSIWPTCKTTTA